MVLLVSFIHPCNQEWITRKESTCELTHSRLIKMQDRALQSYVIIFRLITLLTHKY